MVPCLIGEEKSKRRYTAIDELLASILTNGDHLKNLIFGFKG